MSKECEQIPIKPELIKIRPPMLHIKTHPHKQGCVEVTGEDSTTLTSIEDNEE